MGGKIGQNRDSQTNDHTPGNTQNISKWYAEQLLLLLGTVRTQEPLYQLRSSCSTSFQLQPQCPPWSAKQYTLAGRHPYGASVFQDKAFQAGLCEYNALKHCSFPRPLPHLHLKNAPAFLIKSNCKVTSSWTWCEVWINGLFRPKNQKQLLLVVSKHSTFVILWSRRHPSNLQSTFRHSLTSEELSSPLLKRLQEAHQPEVQRHSKIEAEEQL